MNKDDKFLKFPFANNKNAYIFALSFKTTGALAQLVEQWTENPCVPGSIPGGTTTKSPILLNRVFWF